MNNLLTGFNTLVEALRDRIATLPVSSAQTLGFGKRYHVLSDVTVTLPDVTGRTKDSVIHLSKARGANVTLTVNPANTATQIKAGANLSSTLAIDVDHSLVVYFDSTNGQWVV